MAVGVQQERKLRQLFCHLRVDVVMFHVSRPLQLTHKGMLFICVTARLAQIAFVATCL